MSASKITKITEPEPWTGQYGQMYQANIVLEDGTSGQINMNKPDRWKVGDEVEVTSREETSRGVKLRISKPGGFQGASTPRNSDPGIQQRIDASWAVGQALTRLPQDANVQDAEAKNHLYKDALALLEIRDSLIKTLKSA